MAVEEFRKGLLGKNRIGRQIAKLSDDSQITVRALLPVSFHLHPFTPIGCSYLDQVSRRRLAWRPYISLLSFPFSASVVKAVVSPRPFQYADVSPPPIHLKLDGLRSRYVL
jgi:hypothetical protein